MTICIETSKKWKGIWSFSNESAKVWVCGFLIFYALHGKSFMELICELDKALDKIGVCKEDGDATKINRFL